MSTSGDNQANAGTGATVQNTVVYTAIAGGYDNLKAQVTQGYEFVAFHDNPGMNKTWRLLPLEKELDDANREAKKYKVLPHRYFPEKKYSLWIDGSIMLNISPGSLIEEYMGEYDVVVHQHPDRNCIYQEAEVCARHGLDDPGLINKQVKAYRDAGYPERNGLYELPVILRRHGKRVEEFNELWWAEIRNGSCRDQISFPVVAQRAGIRVGCFPGSVHHWRPRFRDLFYKVERSLVTSVAARLKSQRAEEHPD
jgi:hypothetical protein